MANNTQGQNQGGNQRSGTSNRGFASMDGQQQREIARLGGAAVSEDREHMAAIGRKGGEASAESRQNARTRNALNAAAQDTSAKGGTPGDQRATTRRTEEDGSSRGSMGSRVGNDEEATGNRATLAGRPHSNDNPDHGSGRGSQSGDRGDKR